MPKRTSIAGLALLAACRSQEPAAPPAPASTTASAAPVARASAAAPPPPSGVTTWSFDADAPDAPPKGFRFGRTGEGRDGKWIVRKESDAPSAPNVLAQVDADTTDDRFPVAYADAPLLRDVDVSVRCKPVSGAVDQACGLVFRLQDADNYYLTRANALEANVRLYYLKKGRRQQLAGWSGKVSSGVWHELRAVAKGDHFEISLDGAKIIDHHDGTFADAGKVGVWTKADSVTYFDELTVK